MANKDYSVVIAGSSRELSGKEKVMFKDTSDCVGIDEYTQKNGELIIHPELYVTLAIHNEKAKGDKDYNTLVILDKDGTRYITSSENFADTFGDICADMADCDEEWGIKVLRKPSKNFSGKEFITCTVV